MSTTWDPKQYLKFADARLQPAVDLLARIAPVDPGRIYDLGCGAGNVTRLLRQRWPKADITGVDSSGAMLTHAASASRDITWVQQELAHWQPNVAADLIFSNAALHWLPNHLELLPRLVSCLSPGGWLAIQMPRNFAAPSHALIAEVVRDGSWKPDLQALLRPTPVESPFFYYQLLAPLCEDIEVWETEYLQVLRGPDPVKEWVKGTWLKPLLDRLDQDEQQRFEADYARRLRIAYPALASGVTLFPFKRIFICARRTHPSSVAQASLGVQNPPSTR